MSITGYAGCHVDFERFDTSAGRWYFDDFKRNLAIKRVSYEKLNTTRASVLSLPGKNCYVYFTGGNNFWGFTWPSITKMLAAANEKKAPCWLVLRAYQKSAGKDYYWRISVPSTASSTATRFLCSEATPGTLTLPESWNATRFDTVDALIDNL